MGNEETAVFTITMKIIIKARNQRSSFKTTYQNSCFDENCTENQKLSQELGDFKNKLRIRN